jgi:acyl carrier protein
MTTAHDKLQELWLSRWPMRDERLVAFVVPRADTSCNPEELRSWLRQYLPDYMIPDQVFTVPDLPQVASGKLDRSALRPPFQPGPATRPLIAPRTPTEERIAALFEHVLGVPPQSIDDDFFAHLGGHSLIATQLASLIRREWPIEFPLRIVFESPTVAGLATYVEKARVLDSVRSAIPRQARYDGTAG